jgi:hypothetical protein
MRYRADRHIRKQKKSKIFSDLGRVVGPRPLAQIGTFMMRKPAYIQMAVLSVLGYLSQRDMVQLRGVLLGGTTSLFTRVFGAMLKYGPSYLLKSSKTFADQAGFKYNVAQKRTAFARHQGVLWDYVYGPEAALRYTQEEMGQQKDRLDRLGNFLKDGAAEYPQWVKRLLTCRDGGVTEIVTAQRTAFPISPGIERTRSGFYDSFNHGMQRDYDREQQNRVLGFDINCVEDYVRSAILCEDDTFLREHWKSGTGLIAARSRTALYHDCLTPTTMPTLARWYDMLRAACESANASVWHALTASVLSTKLGKALKMLRKRIRSFEAYDEADLSNVNAQLIFWSGLEERPWVAKYPDLAEAIHDIRQHILTQAFGATQERAAVMQDRLTRYYEMRAMELRRKFDCEYCDVRRPVNWLAGVEVFGDYANQLQEIEAVMQKRSEHLVEFEAYLHSISGELERFLHRSRQESMEYIVCHPERFRAFLKSEQPDLISTYDEIRCNLDEALLAHSDDRLLTRRGIPQALIDACHAYVAHTQVAMHDLFHKANATRLRAAKNAFHANVKNIRSVYERRGGFGMLSEEERDAAVVQVLGEVISTHEEFTLHLMEVRLHHALCRINTLIVADLVSSLRDYEWKPARNPVAKGCRKILNAVKPR